MDLKTKVMIVAGGVALVVGFSALRKSPASPTSAGMDAQTAISINSLANDYMKTQAETTAKILINRDQITGATQIQQWRTIGQLAGINADLAAKMNANAAGIENAKVAASSAFAIERTRASVAKSVNDQQYKIAKKGASNAQLNTIFDGVAGLGKVAGSIVSMFG